MKEYNNKGAIVRNPEDDKFLEEMQKCSYCGGSAYRKILDKKTWDEHPSMPFKCNYCGEILCINCHLPENHNCKNIRPPHTPRKDGKWFTNPDITKYEPKDEVFDNIPKIRPPKVTDKYRSEYVGTTFHNDSVAQDIPKTYPKKSLNWNLIVSILLIIIFSSLLFFLIGNSNSKNTHLTPINFSNDTVNSVPVITNISNTTGTVTQSKFKHTYIDSEGNLHEVTDYTSQGGSKYDVIIKNTSVSKSENLLIVNKVSENKTEPTKNEVSNFIANLEKQIVGWWDETKPRFSNVSSFFTGPKIDSNWVHNFISIINTERTKKGLATLKESNDLDNIANARFKKMMENPMISHYGADEYNVGEVVFYPTGSTEQEYADSIQKTAQLHWDLLMYPSFSAYGYHIEEGPTIVIINSCLTTEIPGPNINIEDFFRRQGCTTEVQNSTWLVIDMI